MKVDKEIIQMLSNRKCISYTKQKQNYNMGPKDIHTGKKITAIKQVTKQHCERHKLGGGLGVVLIDFWFV